ncbi:MAG: ribosome small subunit-dependent GTPase A [Thermaerobacter sp.]|nr:ribosome small subunit-dependent GTPase A [Thermaerobacter sp.]
MSRGVVLRVYGDRALVRSGDTLAEYRPKGTLRKEGLLAGDAVSLEGEHIVAVQPRGNQLGRPPVANASILLAIASVRDPAVSQGDLDRVLLQAEAQRLEPLIVLNKCDLASPEEIEQYLRPYAAAHYPVIRVSTQTGEGIDALRQALPQGIAVLSGQSGVGKSSILRRLTGVDVEIGRMTEKLRRGRHTTRAATLYEAGEGRMIADTPGFSDLELPEIEANRLPSLYPEMEDLGCRFTDCRHRAEPDCAVIRAVEDGTLDAGRYRRYLEFLAELEGRPKRWH